MYKNRKSEEAPIANKSTNAISPQSVSRPLIIRKKICRIQMSTEQSSSKRCVHYLRANHLWMWSHVYVHALVPIHPHNDDPLINKENKVEKKRKRRDHAWPKQARPHESPKTSLLQT